MSEAAETFKKNLENKKTTTQSKTNSSPPLSWRKRTAKSLTNQLVALIARSSITPNMVTWFGFLLSVAAAGLIVSGHLLAAGFVVIIGGFFDMVDGALARSTNRVTTFGSILDSTLDRLSEAALLVGLVVYFYGQASTAGVIITALAIPGSMLVSYIRARAEATQLKGESGLLTRPERVVLMTAGLLLSSINYALITALAIITVLSYITAGQRLFNAWQQTKNN